MGNFYKEIQHTLYIYKKYYDNLSSIKEYIRDVASDGYTDLTIAIVYTDTDKEIIEEYIRSATSYYPNYYILEPYLTADEINTIKNKLVEYFTNEHFTVDTEVGGLYIDEPPIPEAFIENKKFIHIKWDFDIDEYEKQFHETGGIKDV